jgi:hypothetical protein
MNFLCNLHFTKYCICITDLFFRLEYGHKKKLTLSGNFCAIRHTIHYFMLFLDLLSLIFVRLKQMLVIYNTLSFSSEFYMTPTYFWFTAQKNCPKANLNWEFHCILHIFCWWLGLNLLICRKNAPSRIHFREHHSELVYTNSKEQIFTSCTLLFCYILIFHLHFWIKQFTFISGDFMLVFYSILLVLENFSNNKRSLFISASFFTQVIPYLEMGHNYLNFTIHNRSLLSLNVRQLSNLCGW